MQILPSQFARKARGQNPQYNAAGLFGGSSARGGLGAFEQMLAKNLSYAQPRHEAVGRTAGGMLQSASGAEKTLARAGNGKEASAEIMEQVDARFVDAPYNPTPEIFSPFTPQAVRFTPAEMNDLVARLRKDGVSSQALAALEDVAGTVGGPTVEQIFKALRELSPQSEELNDYDKVLLDSLLQKLPDEDGLLRQALESGDPLQAMAALWNSLGKLEGEGINLSQDELGLMGKLLAPGKPDMFAAVPAAAYSGQELRQMLSPLRTEMEKENTARNTLFQSLDKHLPGIMHSARQREETERMASVREQREVANKRITIADKMTETAPGREAPQSEDGNKSTAASGSDSAENTGNGNKAAVLNKRENQSATAGQEKKQNMPEGQSQNGGPRNPAQNGAIAPDAALQAPLRQSLQNPENTAARLNAQAENAATETRPADQAATAEQHGGRERFLENNGDRGERVESRPDPRFHFAGGREDQESGRRYGAEEEKGREKSSRSGHGATFTGATRLAQGPGLESAPAQPAQPQNNQPPLSRQTQAMFEQGVLSAAKDGTARLEVQLNPVELGALTVVLTSRNGEISALIQPERAETTQLIAQQVEQIRAHLENQGIKVEKVEVQTQLADQQGGWQNPDQHNASREQMARNQENGWMRRMGRANGEENDLARNMLLSDYEGDQADNAANLAGSLHLVA